MGKGYLSTSQVASQVGVHPNTVRMYEQWGFLPAIPRADNGYRMFTELHVHQMRAARMAIHITSIGGDIRRTALVLVQHSAAGKFAAAMDLAFQIQELIAMEAARAEAAADVLEAWARGDSPAEQRHSLRIGETARFLAVTADQLHNWERNGLIVVPRDPQNGYRLYGALEIDRLRVIRILRSAKFSMMAILRMLTRFDSGEDKDLRQVLDTPGPDEEEDAVFVADRWLSTLTEMSIENNKLISLLTKIEKEYG